MSQQPADGDENHLQAPWTEDVTGEEQSAYYPSPYDEPSLDGPGSQMPPPPPRVAYRRASHTPAVFGADEADQPSTQAQPCTQGDMANADNEAAEHDDAAKEEVEDVVEEDEAEGGAHETFMPLTQAPLTQAPWIEAELSPIDGNVPVLHPGSKRGCAQTQMGVLAQQEKESVAPAQPQDSLSPPPPAADEWPTKCPRCNARCGDVHVALSCPLRYCAPGQTTPDVLGLFAIDIVALWR